MASVVIPLDRFADSQRPRRNLDNSGYHSDSEINRVAAERKFLDYIGMERTGVPSNMSIASNVEDRRTMLAFMYIRFREKRIGYAYAASFYRRLDIFLFFLPLMLLQCAVAVVYVAASKDQDFQRIFGGCVSAVSAVLIAIQMKMKLSAKAEKFKSAMKQFALLASETFYFWATFEPHKYARFVKDAGELEREIEETSPTPPSWITRKFERHRIQMTASDKKGTPNLVIPTPPEMPDLKRVRRRLRRQENVVADESSAPLTPTLGVVVDNGEDVADTLQNPTPPEKLKGKEGSVLKARTKVRRQEKPSAVFSEE